MNTNLYTDYYQDINKPVECTCGLKQACKADISNICAWCKVTGKDKNK